jgi:hypothetical protein
MTSLADLLDPDQWIVSGKNLSDFPWPDGSNEREAMKLILSTRPVLKGHFERWSKRVMEALGRRGGEKVGDVFMEEYLRELWERSALRNLIVGGSYQAKPARFSTILVSAASHARSGIGVKSCRSTPTIRNKRTYPAAVRRKR